jgi:capsular polysaccharide transport system permease protein
MLKFSNGFGFLTVFSRAWSKARGKFESVKSGGASEIGNAVAVQLSRAPALLNSAVEGGFAVDSNGGSLLGKSFLALVLAPSLVFFLYAALWQSNGYVAEARLTVRSAQEQKSAVTDASSIIGKLSGGSPKATIQDSYIVLNYIKSQAILADLGGRDYLERYFSVGYVDYFSRLPHAMKAEDLLQYWLKIATASVDTVSGILTLKVEGFRAEDAAQIAKDIVRLSEALVNNVTMRSRTDALARAEREVSLSADKLATAREKLTAFRNQGSLIDPASRAQSVGETLGKLTLDKISIENALATLQGSLAVDSPTQRIQRARLAAIDQQIADLKKTLTDPTNDQAVSSQIASYERLKLNEQFNERMYTIAENSFQRARQELEKQQLYLVVVVPPTLPERATYPKVIASSLLLFAALFIFWAIGALIAASINDQMV